MSSQNNVPVEESFEFCRKLALSHYENFTVVSFLLPRVLRRPFFAVYAYCRISDDLADESPSPQIALEKLDHWEKELDRCFDRGEAEHPVFIALREIAREHRLEKKPFSDLLLAFRRDQVPQRYDSMEDLLQYCRYSADPVGRIILQLGASAGKAGPPTPDMLRYSDSICTGLQLANFWQDVARDWEKGRFYVPLSYCERFQYDPEESPRHNERFVEMMKVLVEDARERLTFGKPLVREVPRFLRTDISLFIEGGLAILDAIQGESFNVWNHRPSVSSRKKLLLFLRTCIVRKP